MRGPSFCAIFLFAFSIISFLAAFLMYATHPLFNPDITTTPTNTAASLTHYDILQATPGATDSELKRAFRHQVLKYHPDKHLMFSADKRKAAAERYSAITSSYEFLTSGGERCYYDYYVVGGSLLDYMVCKHRRFSWKAKWDKIKTEWEKIKFEVMLAEKRRRREEEPVVNEKLWRSRPIYATKSSSTIWLNHALKMKRAGNLSGLRRQGRKTDDAKMVGRVKSLLEALFTRRLEFVDWLGDITYRFLIWLKRQPTEEEIKSRWSWGL
ncbi:hypothetical protein HD806DRAFT_162149 [Xylariaceae sp. AK1471]|nr:hypothetical protein HD806DRAFT_162149 [Xylariaceae sp. AK1471]